MRHNPSFTRLFCIIMESCRGLLCHVSECRKGGVWSGGGVSAHKPPRPLKPPKPSMVKGLCYHAYFSRTIVCFHCGWEEAPEPSKPSNATHPLDHPPPFWACRHVRRWLSSMWAGTQKIGVGIDVLDVGTCLGSPSPNPVVSNL